MRHLLILDLARVGTGRGLGHEQPDGTDSRRPSLGSAHRGGRDLSDRRGRRPPRRRRQRRFWLARRFTTGESELGSSSSSRTEALDEGRRRLPTSSRKTRRKRTLIVPSRNAAYKAAVTRSAVVPGLNRLAGMPQPGIERLESHATPARTRASRRRSARPPGARPRSPGRARTCARSVSPGAVPEPSNSTQRSRFRAASPRCNDSRSVGNASPRTSRKPLAYCRAIKSRSAAMPMTALSVIVGSRAISWSDTSPSPPGWARRIAR